MATKLQEKAGVIDVKSRELSEIFEKYPNLDMPADVAADIKNRNDELTDLGKEYDSLKALEDIETKNKERLAQVNARLEGLPISQKGKLPSAQPTEQKTFGELFVESKAFSEFKNGHGPAIEIEGKQLFERKTVLDTSSGYAPQAVRINKLVPYATETPMVMDLIPQGVTDQNAIKYMEETTFTNAAAPTSEKGDSPESSLGFTEKSSDVRKISTFLPITEEMIEDVPGIMSVVDSRLRLFLQLNEETQVLSGNGTPPNLRGLMNTVGIQTQPRGTDPTPDAVYKAMTLIQVNSFLRASGIIMHPTDWEGIRLMKTTDGIYIWGSPSEAGLERIWALPVVKTTSMTLNTSLVGAFDTATQIFRKKNITIEVSNSHSDFFIKGQLAVRADERLALVVYRPAALATVTGI